MAEWIMKEETDMDGVGCYIRKGELIRCKDCKFYQKTEDDQFCGQGSVVAFDEHYCSIAERKVDADADEKKQAYYEFTITCLAGNVDKLTRELERFMSDEVGAENWVMRRELIEEEE